MKTTNKKEFSKFLNKFEKLLSYNIENLGMGVKFDIFKNDTQKFLKTSHCRFILYTESGRIYFKISFFDKNENEVFSKNLNKSNVFVFLNKKDVVEIATSSPIDLSDVPMEEYNFFKNKSSGKKNYEIYKNFIRVAIAKFDFLYNDLDSFENIENETSCYLNGLNELLNILTQGNFSSSNFLLYTLLLQNKEERNHLFGKYPFFFSYSELKDTFNFLVRKIERSIENSEKLDKKDVDSLLSVVSLFGKQSDYNDFTKKLALTCFYIKKLSQKSKFKLEESNCNFLYDFVYHITQNKSDDLVIQDISETYFISSKAPVDYKLKVSDLKSTFRLVAKK